MSGASGLRFLFKEVSQFVPPWIPMTIVAVPCVANAYGIVKFKHHSFFDNKPNENASKFQGEHES
ncbi:transmembrane protein [Cystoisospora suis]|uniref:Transmembrane protein n=1 Tax=Cystoisospora suis TaxID=483139 RepID=A0A2C6KYW5_9APIC|nr:transmembrane protein [Cystoisospora suis]